VCLAFSGAVAAIRKPFQGAGPALVKSLLVLGLLGAALVLVAPPGRDFAARTSVAAGADAILAALHTARMEALVRNTQVTICKSSNFGNERPACAESSAEWPEGWVVFVDHGTIGTIEAGDKIISRGRSDGKIDLAIEQPVRVASITFHPVGPITGPVGTLELHFASSLTRGTFERVICLSILGRAHVSRSGSCQA
jgi:type IV fimbrial biogenesis protein FimT